MAQHNHHGADTIIAAETPHANGEMNITPLIDVLLVLLIIFMATLPLNQRGLDVNLPATTSPASAAPSPQIVLEYTRDKRISINKQEVELQDLESRLTDVYENRRDKTIYLMADGGLRYGEIALPQAFPQ